MMYVKKTIHYNTHITYYDIYYYHCTCIYALYQNVEKILPVKKIKLHCEKLNDPMKHDHFIIYRSTRYRHHYIFVIHPIKDPFHGFLSHHHHHYYRTHEKTINLHDSLF